MYFFHSYRDIKTFFHLHHKGVITNVIICYIENTEKTIGGGKRPIIYSFSFIYLLFYLFIISSIHLSYQEFEETLRLWHERQTNKSDRMSEPTPSEELNLIQPVAESVTTLVRRY